MQMPKQPRQLKTPKDIVLSVRLERSDYALLGEIQERDGVPVSEQIRRGVRLWLEQKGVSPKKQRKS